MNWINIQHLTDIGLKLPVFAVYCSFMPDYTELCNTIITESEQKKYASIQNKTELQSRAVLRLILGAFFEKPPSEVNIELTKKIKPYVAKTNFRFSVTHTNSSFLIAFNQNGRIGADMEKLKGNENLKLLADYAFSTHEKQLFYADNGTEQFCKIWTQKEALLKALGVGLVQKLETVNSFEKINQYGFQNQYLNCPDNETATIVYDSQRALKNIYRLSLNESLFH